MTYVGKLGANKVYGADAGGKVGGAGRGGPAPAIDANHIYVWACDDASGSSTLANTGASAGGTATITGSSSLQSSRLTRGGKSILFAGAANGDGASATVSIPTNPGGSPSGFSLEAYVIPDSFINTAAAGIMSAGVGSPPSGNDYAQIGLVQNGSFYYYFIDIRQAPNSEHLFRTSIPVSFGVPAHLLATFNATTGDTKLYVNGYLRASGNATNFPSSTLTTLTLAGVAYDTTYPMGGTIMQARVSDVVRDDAYAIETAKTLFAM